MKIIRGSKKTSGSPGSAGGRKERGFLTIKHPGRWLMQQKESHLIWSVMLLVGISMFILGLAVYPILSRHSKAIKNVKKTFLSVRVLDQNSRPVPGAGIQIQGKSRGVTDSFGGWKGNVEVDVRKKIVLKVVKSGKLKQFTSEKIIDHLAAGETKANNRVTVRIPWLPDNPGSQGLLKQKSSGLPPDQQAGHPKSPVRNKKNRFQSVWFSVIDNKSDSKKTMVLKKYLLPALKAKARMAGLQLAPDSGWQVGLVHVPDASSLSFSGVIRVISRASGSRLKTDFLRNYTGNSQKTATGILNNLKSHTPKAYLVESQSGNWIVQPAQSLFWKIRSGQWLRNKDGRLFQIFSAGVNQTGLAVGKFSPCGSKKRCYLLRTYALKDPPSNGWSIQRRHVYGVNSGQANVYVGGYKAVSEGNHMWRFWFRPGYSSYLSVISDGRIVYRKLIDGTKRQPIVAQIPGNNRPK